MIFRFAMPRPAFRGVAVLGGIEGLANPRGFVLADAYQRNPNFPNIFAIGVCVAIPRVGRTSAHCCAASRCGARDMGRGVSGGFRQSGRRLGRPAADPAAGAMDANAIIRWTREHLSTRPS